MSEKTMEMMKKLLEKKKAANATKTSHVPAKKLGHGSSAKKNQKPGGSNNKV
ncbi:MULTISPECIES: hypothetical protein [unclassified Fusibacter]|uniref:hypothetical protein n=1 Tax=unclassified Fusibacter TaxID=2624464 RepID=UPI0013E975D4|nr:MULTISPECIES: hypothetical protein [unclassified Fusibacter]MCK8061205.1 hypothetical protein [Fusibacter sp. A2]NPE23451.1 hypothetical protein [Fusibacter sp. A1]